MYSTDTFQSAEDRAASARKRAFLLHSVIAYANRYCKAQGMEPPEELVETLIGRISQEESRIHQPLQIRETDIENLARSLAWTREDEDVPFAIACFSWARLLRDMQAESLSDHSLIVPLICISPLRIERIEAFGSVCHGCQEEELRLHLEDTGERVDLDTVHELFPADAIDPATGSRCRGFLMGTGPLGRIVYFI